MNQHGKIICVNVLQWPLLHGFANPGQRLRSFRMTIQTVVRKDLTRRQSTMQRSILVTCHHKESVHETNFVHSTIPLLFQHSM
jgi:hypothetical protein